MPVAGLVLGQSAVGAWVRSHGSGLGAATVPVPTSRPSRTRVELEPAVWEAAARAALRTAVATAGRPGDDYLGLVVSGPVGGFVLLDAGGEPLGRAVHPGDRRGAPYAGVLDGWHARTGRQPDGGLVLPALLAVRAQEPERWAATARVLSLADWLVQRLCGVQVAEVSYACAGAMADVAARTWAVDLLDGCGLGTKRLAPVVEPGTVVGELLPGWPLPASLPVVTGAAGPLLEAAGVGGLAEGVAVVLAGSAGTAVVLASVVLAPVVVAPVSAPALGADLSISTHADRGLWAVQGAVGAPASVRPRAGEVPERAFGVRSLLEAAPDRVRDVVVTGRAAADGRLPAALAEVLGREVRHARTGGVPEAGEALVGRAVGAHSHLPRLPAERVGAVDPGAWEQPYARWRAGRGR